MRRTTRWLLYIGVVLAAFAIVYSLTEPDSSSQPTVEFKDIKTLTAALNDRRAGSRAALQSAAEQSGLRVTPYIKGFVEEVRRTEGDVQLSGWLVDSEGDGRPIHLFIFTGGKLVAQSQTKGERDDITKSLNLSFEERANVKFSVRVKCASGDIPQILAVTYDGFYSIRSAERCP